MADVGRALLIHILALACPPHAATQNINPEKNQEKFMKINLSSLIYGVYISRKIYLEKLILTCPTQRDNFSHLGNKPRKIYL